METTLAIRRLTLMIGVLAFVVTACGSDPGTTTTAPETSTTTTTTTSPAVETEVVVYFMLADPEEGSGPFLVPVYRGSQPNADPAAVLAALLDGPTGEEETGIPAISTAIPSGVTVNSIEVSGGVAAVDLSGSFGDGGGSLSMFSRLAQVVYTLTRLPDIDSVQFSLDGTVVDVFSSEGILLDAPQTRADYYDLLPPIFVDSPAWGEPVTSPVVVVGLSNVFEATSQIMLTDDDGLPLFEGTVTATCGTGCWGDWSIDVPYTVDREQFGAIIVWEFSAEDGSRIHIREYPIRLR